MSIEPTPTDQIGSSLEKMGCSISSLAVTLIFLVCLGGCVKACGYM
jgi:hypothetical protein